jgi:hypothetical protein
MNFTPHPKIWRAMISKDSSTLLLWDQSGELVLGERRGPPRRYDDLPGENEKTIHVDRRVNQRSDQFLCAMGDENGGGKQREYTTLINLSTNDDEMILLQEPPLAVYAMGVRPLLSRIPLIRPNIIKKG